MTTEQIEHEQSTLEGYLECPNERTHNFVTMSALCDFVQVFKLTNFNVRSGYLQETGKQVVQLTYSTVSN